MFFCNFLMFSTANYPKIPDGNNDNNELIFDMVTKPKCRNHIPGQNHSCYFTANRTKTWLSQQWNYLSVYYTL